jgi:hypothetical protein
MINRANIAAKITPGTWQFAAELCLPYIPLFQFPAAGKKGHPITSQAVASCRTPEGKTPIFTVGM